MKKPKTKRQKEKYQALKPELNLKTRYEEVMDMNEYFHTLPEAAKEWANKFAEEYIHASLDSKKLKNNLHNTKALKKSCYDKNNARNRDVISTQRAANNLSGLDDLKKKEAIYEIEDNLIKKIDEET